MIADLPPDVGVSADQTTRPPEQDHDDVRTQLRRAIFDPGKWLARGDDYTEPIASWTARAAFEAVVAPLLTRVAELEAETGRLTRVLAGARAAEECWYTSDGPDSRCTCGHADLWPRELTIFTTAAPSADTLREA